MPRSRKSRTFALGFSNTFKTNTTMEENKKQEPRLTSVWVRVGMTMRLTDEEVKAIAENKPVHFNTIMDEGRCFVNGDCYVPYTTLDWADENDRRFCEAMGFEGEEDIDDCEIDFKDDNYGCKNCKGDIANG